MVGKNRLNEWPICRRNQGPSGFHLRRIGRAHVGLVVAAAQVLGCGDGKLEGVRIEEIANSERHFSGTWWGYNMSKIVRRGDVVYRYNIENDVPAGEPYAMTLYAKEGDRDWRRGASFTTSRPGNLLIDGEGKLHALVFEAADMATNDSIGRLVHYESTEPGGIDAFKRDVVVPNDGSQETVNIRVGAAISTSGRLVTGWGIRRPAPDKQSIEFYEKPPDATGWTHLSGPTNLGHDFYYPFIVAPAWGIASLHVQDDLVQPENTNIYYRADYFERRDGTWRQQTLVDRRNHPLAEQRNQIVEQSDLYLDGDGHLHAVVKERLDPDNPGDFSAIRHFVHDGDELVEQGLLGVEQGRCNWVRLFEYDGALHFACVTWRRLFVRRVGGQTVEIELPRDATGTYLYVPTPRAGSERNPQYLDLMLVSGNSEAYPGGPAYYVQVPMASLEVLAP